jgi:hypothetical protein
MDGPRLALPSFVQARVLHYRFALRRFECLPPIVMFTGNEKIETILILDSFFRKDAILARAKQSLSSALDECATNDWRAI